MKCKFHRPTSIIHLKMCNTQKNLFYFFIKKKLKNILNKPRMKCMNVMQRKTPNEKHFGHKEMRY